MAASQVVMSDIVTVTDNTTRFTSLTGAAGTNATEANRQCAIREAGNFSNLYVRVTANSVSVASSTVTLRKDTVDTALQVLFGVDETGVKEDTDSVAFAANTKADYAIVAPTEAGTNTITVTEIGVKFTPTDTSKTTTFLVATALGNVAFASATRYGCFGDAGIGTVENNQQLAIRGSFTSTYLWANVSANARTTDTVFSTRIDASPGGQSVTYASGETGYKEDAAGSDSLTSGNEFCLGITTVSDTASMTIQNAGCMLTSTAGEFMLSAQSVNPVNQAFNVTNNVGVSGNSTAVDTTEANVQIIPQFTFTAKNLNALVSANTIGTSASTITLRDGGGNSALSLSYAAAETGVKVDTDTTEITSGTDTIDYQVITPNTSGTFSFRNISITGAVASGVVATIIHRLASLGAGA